MKNGRRRQSSKSPEAASPPSGKRNFFLRGNKRRAFKHQDTSFTEGESMCSDDSEAPWKVGTFEINPVR